MSPPLSVAVLDQEQDVPCVAGQAGAGARVEAGEDQARRRQGREAGLPPPRRLRGDRGHGRDGGWAARLQRDARRTPTTRARAAQRRGRHCLYSPAASTVRRVQSNEYEYIACTVRVHPASSPRTGRRHQERCPVEDARPAAPARRGRRRQRRHPANAGTDTGTGTRIYHRHCHRAGRTPAPTLAPADADTGTPRTPTPAAAAPRRLGRGLPRQRRLAPRLPHKRAASRRRSARPSIVAEPSGRWPRLLLAQRVLRGRTAPSETARAVPS
jgi:hypothetical protein